MMARHGFPAIHTLLEALYPGLDDGVLLTAKGTATSIAKSSRRGRGGQGGRDEAVEEPPERLEADREAAVGKISPLEDVLRRRPLEVYPPLRPCGLHHLLDKLKEMRREVRV